MWIVVRHIIVSGFENPGNAWQQRMDNFTQQLVGTRLTWGAPMCLFGSTCTQACFCPRLLVTGWARTVLSCHVLSSHHAQLQSVCSGLCMWTVTCTADGYAVLVLTLGCGLPLVLRASAGHPWSRQNQHGHVSRQSIPSCWVICKSCLLPFPVLWGSWLAGPAVTRCATKK
jgi:hypothetical protein